MYIATYILIFQLIIRCQKYTLLLMAYNKYIYLYTLLTIPFR